MPLLERESALASLAAYAREAQTGDGRLVLIAGEAGVGKSALVEQLERDLPDAIWAWGACDGLSTPRPLGPLLDLADQLGGELLRLCRDHAGRDDLFRALLRHVSASAGLSVLVLEDMHWADEATIDLLRFLGRRLRNTPILLLATYRDDGLDSRDPLRVALGELATQRTTRRIGLAPLSELAVGALAAGSGLLAADLYGLTGGNPFYVTEVLRSGMDEMPPSARDAALARVASLSPPARAVLDVAALVGTRTELRLLTSVTECSPAILDELLTSGLLIGDEAATRFRHEIAHRAIAEAVAAHRRGGMHTQILAALRLIGSDDDAAMAFHAEAAGDGPAALNYATRAAHCAVELASHREAAAQFERALRQSAGATDAVIAALYDGYAGELYLLDRLHEAVDASERALVLWRRTGDRLREGNTLVCLSRSFGPLCRGRETLTAATAAVTALEPLGPSPELAWAYVNLAGIRMTNGDREQAAKLAARARDIAEPLGVHEVMSHALNTEGCVAASRGEEWSELMTRALDIAIEHRLDACAGRAFVNLHGVHCAQRRFAAAERYYVDGIAYGDDHDLSTYTRCLRSERTGSLEKLGRWDESMALSLELLAEVGASPLNQLCARANIGTIRARQGADGAWECLDIVRPIADDTGEAQHIVPILVARAEAYWLEGADDLARGEIAQATTLAADCDAWDRGPVALWQHRLHMSPIVEGELARPYQMEIDGDWATAVQLWTDLGCRYDAALCLLFADDEVAQRRAVGLLADLGATATVRVGRQRMRASGFRVIPTGARAATRDHPVGLTRREGEVLDLICDGCTNAEIAAHLVISAKTVDHHVSAVLGKLGTPTRAAAAAEANRLGLVGALTSER